jgi:uncharacterized membrane protein
VRWALAFRIRQSLKGSLWVVPLLGGVVGYWLSYLSVSLEQDRFVPSGWDYSASTAQVVLTSVVAATVGLMGFVVTVSVLVVQTATGTFSARYMRLWYRDFAFKATLAVLLGTMLFAYSLLRRIDETVPNSGVTLAGFFLAIGLLLFLVFLDRSLHRLRPVKVAELVARAGRESLRATVRIATTQRSGTDPEIEALLAREPALLVHSKQSGSLQAIDDEGLLKWATHHDAVIVLRHGVGDFVSRGTVVLEAHATLPFPRVAERRLAGRLAFGIERTIEQDPAFALRVLVDVAVRALSPAVNDPTTATQVLDHLEDTLLLIGRTPGLDGRWEYRDEQQRLRLVMPSQRFEDFLALGVTEIREYGGASIQVMRRLRATLLELESSVLPEYAPAVAAELEKLNVTAGAMWDGTPDAEISRRADRQGIGGPARLS